MMEKIIVKMGCSGERKKKKKVVEMVLLLFEWRRKWRREWWRSCGDGGGDGGKGWPTKEGGTAQVGCCHLLAGKRRKGK